MNFRIATNADLTEIFQFWTEVFGVWEPLRKQVMHNSVDVGLRTGVHKILLAEERGKIIGTVKNELSSHRYGNVILRKADVGEVAISPEMQGKGLGTNLMTENQKVLKAEEVDIARLGGLCKFYSRFGYYPIPSISWELPLAPIPGGIKKISPWDLAHLDDSILKNIKFLNMPEQIPVWARLHNEFYKDYFFSEKIDARMLEYWTQRATPKDNIKYLGYWSGDILKACFVFCGPPSSPRIIDVLCDTGSEYCLEILLKYIIKYVCNTSSSGISMKFCHTASLLNTGFVFKKIERYSNSASSMISVLDINNFFNKLLPIFNKRLTNNNFINIPDFYLTFSDTPNEIAFNCQKNKLKLGYKSSSFANHVNIDFGSFLLILQGYKTFEDLAYKINSADNSETIPRMLDLIFHPAKKTVYLG